MPKHKMPTATVNRVLTTINAHETICPSPLSGILVTAALVAEWNIARRRWVAARTRTRREHPFLICEPFEGPASPPYVKPVR